jgi:N-acetyl-gamma-glutamylphosphate reductase
VDVLRRAGIVLHQQDAQRPIPLNLTKPYAAREAAALVTNPKARLIDASTAHRTDPHWVYGLPELLPGHREVIAQSKRVSNPGCHASAFILLLRPQATQHRQASLLGQ